jgi:hypothetical protein
VGEKINGPSFEALKFILGAVSLLRSAWWLTKSLNFRRPEFAFAAPATLGVQMDDFAVCVRDGIRVTGLG